jgi:ABC-2 type transport system ATP-binding protein
MKGSAMSVDDEAGPPVLAASGLEVRYGKRLLLDGLSLEARRGQVVALLGRNGSGKTSLVRCLLGQQKPTRGAARLFGRDSWTARRQVMERVGVLPEEPDAPASMTAEDLSDFCRRLYPRWDAAAVRSRLDRFGVPQDRPFSRLSRGERGAVMLALSLGHSPELLVLDDPTLGLDAVARRALFEEVISELADRGTTVFVTSHDLAGVDGLADRIGILHAGRLLVDEPLDALKARFRRLRVAVDAPAEWEPFEVVASRTQPWGHEATVSNFDDGRWEAFLQRRADRTVEVAGLTLEEIFLARCGEKA